MNSIVNFIVPSLLCMHLFCDRGHSQVVVYFTWSCFQTPFHLLHRSHRLLRSVVRSSYITLRVTCPYVVPAFAITATATPGGSMAYSWNKDSSNQSGSWGQGSSDKSSSWGQESTNQSGWTGRTMRPIGAEPYVVCSMQ